MKREINWLYPPPNLTSKTILHALQIHTVVTLLFQNGHQLLVVPDVKQEASFIVSMVIPEAAGAICSGRLESIILFKREANVNFS